MTKQERMKRCAGCRDNFYNGNNDLGVRECWSLKSARVVWKKEVSMDQRPPWNQPAKQVLSCYRRNGYVYVGPNQTR